MLKNKFILFLFIINVAIQAQNLDSLYNEFLSSKGRIVSAPHVLAASPHVKCGFGLAASIMINYDKFTQKQKKVIESLLSRPACDTSVVSPQKHFKIYFYKSGNEVPTYNINELAKAADSSYNYEVKVLGFPPPPNDSDGYYPIFIADQGSGYYGQTWQEKNISPNTWTSYITMSNNYEGSGYYTNGINSARVTIAHEFHHAIQMGGYILRYEDRFYHELTSTSMEAYVYGSIKDYYQYLNSYFQNPEKSINAFGSDYAGYNLAIWHFYLTSKFGMNVIKEIWEKMPNERALECINDVLGNHGSSLLKEFNQFGVWTYFTNKRAIPGQYFKDAANYPLLKFGLITPLKNPTTTVSVSSNAISNNFLEFTDGADTLISIVTNADVPGLINAQSPTPFNLSITRSPSNGFANIDHGFYSKLSSSNPSILFDSYLFNSTPASKIINMDYAYPQPFSYSVNSTLYFPAELISDGKADLFIYSIDMNLVYSSQTNIVSGEKVAVAWNALDNNGRKLSSGVYLYVVKCADNIRKGKFVIIND